MRTRRAIAATAVAAAVTALATGCSTPSSSGAPPVLEIEPDDREEPVVLSGTTLDGEALDVSAFLGRPVVLNVWWSGCGPCQREMPLLNQVAETGEAQFVGINARDVSAGNARAFERRVDVTYPSLYPGDELLLQLGDYAPRALPSTVVLDSRGRVAALITGEVPSVGTLEAVIESVDRD